MYAGGDSVFMGDSILVHKTALRSRWPHSARLTTMESVFARVFLAALVSVIAVDAQSLLPVDVASSFALSGESAADLVSAQGPGFNSAIRFSTLLPGRAIADSSASWSNTATVHGGDRLTLTLWVRKVAPEDFYNVRATVAVESDGGDSLLDTVFPCNLGTWAKYSFPLAAPRDYDAGTLRLVFRHGLGPQTYEIGGLQWTDQGQPVAPPQPVGSLIPTDSARTYGAYFDTSVGGGSARVVPGGGPAGGDAIQVQVNGTSPNIYNAQLGWPTSSAVNKNDAVLLSFRARLLKGSDTGIQGQIVFERNGDPYDKSVTFTYPVATADWQLLQVPFRANDNFQPGKAHLQFQFAAGPQIFEIADVSLQNYGPVSNLTSLPNHSAFRIDNVQQQILDDARKRIETVRRVPVTVVVADPDGNPVPNVEVRIQQLRHAFRFGSAVVSGGLMQSGQDNDIYRSRIASHFNTSVLENDLKWPVWECGNCKPGFDQSQTRSGIQWLLDRGIPVRGHNLIWPSFRNMPNDIQKLTGDALRSRINNHFQNVLTDPGTNGTLYQWDVVNEPFDNFDVQGRIDGVSGVAPSQGLLGNNELLDWYRQARAVDPAAKLFLNDYSNVETSTPGQHEDYTVKFIEWMQLNNAALDGIGIQAHFGGSQSMSRIQAVFDRFARFGLPLDITEFDFNSNEESAQASFTRDFMTLVFSRPEFNDFLMWGFWEGRHWLPQGAMYTKDWTSKQNALVYNRLLFQEWWTNGIGTTGDDGRFTLPAFLGDYQITVVGPDGPVTRVVAAGDLATVPFTLAVK